MKTEEEERRGEKRAKECKEGSRNMEIYKQEERKRPAIREGR